MHELLKQGEERYKQRAAEEQSRVLVDNPLAYEYDALYDEESSKRDTVAALKKVNRENLKSRYLQELELAAEKRTREQSAAWENMERKERIREVQTGQAAVNSESFITDSYRRQLELNNQSKMLESMEDKVNERRTANAETGMMGFYSKFLTRTIEGVVQHNTQAETPLKQEVLPTTREKLDDKLKQLKSKQEEKEREERARRQLELKGDGDPF